MNKKIEILIAAFTMTLATLSSQGGYAGPQGGVVAGGNATIVQQGPTTHITQTTDKAIINWNSYNVGAAEKVIYQQPNSGSIALNRINPAQGASSIYGQISANGQVWLVNPAGIWFGPNAYVNVAGLVATTANINDHDFMAGQYRFQQSPAWHGSVVNEGTIVVHNAGLAALVGSGAVNNGRIEAQMGTVVLGSSTAYTIDFSGDQLVQFAVGDANQTAVDKNGQPLESAVSNKGTISAAGGKVLLSAQSAGQVLNQAINMEGVVEAKSVGVKNGEIILMGGEGDVRVSGKLIASGKQAGERGGAIRVLGKRIALEKQAIVDASGDQGGGKILVGGDFQGKNPTIKNAKNTTVGKDVTLLADAMTQGDGGQIVLWSDDHTSYLGSIFSRGGALSGDGGDIEVSGKETLDYRGNVDASAANGVQGTLLLDPRFITIQSSGGSSYQAGVNNLYADNPAGTTVITPDSLNAAAADITLEANSDVTFNEAVNLTTANKFLVVRAGRSIFVNANLTTNNGDIILTANQADADINFRTGGAGSISMGGGVSINAGTGLIHLEIGNLVGGTPGGINAYALTNTGSNGINIISRNDINLNAAVTSGTGAIAIQANTKGSGSEGFTMSSGSSLVTNNTTNSAVSIAVNAAGGGSGSINIGNVSTGSGGGVTATTATGGNTTGGSIQQVASTSINAGTNGSFTFAVPTSGSSSIGNNSLPITTVSNGGILTLTGGQGGITISNTGDITLATPTLNANTPFSVTSSGTLTLPASALAVGSAGLTLRSNGGTLTTAGALSTNSNTLTLYASGLLTINHNLSTNNGTMLLTGTGISQGGSSVIDGTYGNITLNAGTGTFTTNNGSKVYTGSTIDIIADALAVNSGSQIGGTGAGAGTASTLIIEPGSIGTTIGVAGGAGALNISSTVLGTLRATNLRLGNVNAGAMAVASAGTPWTTSSTYLSNTLTLAAGGITQAAAIDIKTNSNAKLLVRGTGDVILTNTSNKFSNILASKTNGAFSLTNASTNALTVSNGSDDMGNVNGITTPGAVTLNASGAGGSLTIAQSIATTNNNISLTGTGVSQSNGTNVNSGSGTISINGGGSSMQLNSGTLTSSNATTSAIQLANASTIALGNISAASGGLVLGVGNVSGAVTQNASTTLAVNSLSANTSSSINLGNTPNTIASLGAITRGGALTINNTGALSVNGAIATGVVNNALSITTTGLLTLANNILTSGANNISLTGNGITQTSGTVNSNSGTITMSGGGGAMQFAGLLTNTNATASALRFLNATSLALGNITVNSGTVVLGTGNITGAVTQTAATSVSTGTLIGNTTNAITLNNASNSIATLGSITRGGAFSLVTTSALNMTGPLNLGTLTNAVTIAAGGLLTINGGIQATGGSTISLTGVGVTQAASTVVNAGSGDLIANAGAGTLTLGNASQLLSTGKITLSADAMSLAGGATPSQIGGTGTGAGLAGTVILQPGTANKIIGIAGAAGDLLLSSGALSDVRATNVRIGNSGVNSIAVNAWTPGANFATNGVLTLQASGDITQGGVINLGTSNAKLALRSGGNITLNSNNILPQTLAGNVTGNLSLTSTTHALSIDSITDDIGTINGISAGTVTLNASNAGLILNSGIIASGNGNAIVLAGQSFINNVGSNALTAASGNYLLWTVDPSNDTLGGLTYNFKQYNAIYNSTSVLGTGNGVLYSIAPVITASLIGNVTKVYDGTTAATLAGANYSSTGSINGDTVTLNNPVNGNYDNKNVGTNKNVAVTGIAIASATNGAATVYGYQLAASSANANIGTITAKDLTTTGVVANNKIYDGNTTATFNTTSAGLSGVVDGDTVTLNSSSATGIFNNKNVGFGKAVTAMDFALSGSDASNYTLTQPTGLTATIFAKDLTITGALANNKIYDGNTTATLNNASSALSGVVDGDTVNLDSNSSTATFNNKNIGVAKPVTAIGYTITGSDASNYALSQPTGLTATIFAKDLTITGAVANNKIYDGNTTATLNNASSALSGVVDGDTVNLDSNSSTATFNNKNVGVAKPVTAIGYTITGSDASNYALSQPTGLTATIFAKDLTITGAVANNKIYDGNTTATLNNTSSALSGVVDGDAVNLDSNSSTGTFNNKNVGVAKPVTASGYTITGIDASNYALSQPTGLTATIFAKDLTITGALANNKVYDGNAIATLNNTGSALSGVVMGDTVNLDSDSSTATFNDKNVGVAKPVTAMGYTITGSDASNYALSQPTGLTANITAKDLIITGVVANNKVYDATTLAVLNNTSASLSGVIGGDNVNLDSLNAIGNFVNQDAGINKSVIATGYTIYGSGSSNYSVSQPSGLIADITQAPLSVIGITVNDKYYNGTTLATLATSTAQLIGVFSGDTVTLDVNHYLANFINPDVGNDIPVTVSGLSLDGVSASNYALNQPTNLTGNILSDVPPVPPVPPAPPTPTPVITPSEASSLAPAQVVFPIDYTPANQGLTGLTPTTSMLMIENMKFKPYTVKEGLTSCVKISSDVTLCGF
ncbi:MAG: filamentous hemagglutinin N-terminal domain-containing protein [Gammaproteobacteria bacterium]|nr:filamentous hemagglutinin N-terminal domain-containing protein [Gammaproteobacteria bacterium]